MTQPHPARSIHTRGSFPGRKSVRAHLKHRIYCCVRIRCQGNVFTEPLISNGRLFRLHYPGFQELGRGPQTQSQQGDLINLLFFSLLSLFLKKNKSRLMKSPCFQNEESKLKKAHSSRIRRSAHNLLKEVWTVGTYGLWVVSETRCSFLRKTPQVIFAADQQNTASKRLFE